MNETHPMRNGGLPGWADVVGADEFGPFAGVVVGGARQDFRWVSPGMFVMGSPASEAGRYGEVQHRVRLTRGYWMADTPVTQALWVAVMGSNPSRFQTPDRPVEQVSWDDAVGFIGKLNGERPGLELRLPTEAEWECACRAGTTRATYAGDLQILGERNAPVLDDIAWYGGNSGHEWDLDDGYNSSGWPEKQYPHTEAGTRPVRLKAPNGLGLYDMLGNVWEWCSDWHGDYAGEATDPQGPADGAGRVFRGGSWFDDAGRLRAASRDWGEPGGRDDDLGFRLARGQALQGRGAPGRSPR